MSSRSWSQDKPEEYPVREVDRPIVIPPGMYETGFFLTYLDTEEIYDDEGELVSFDDTYRLMTLRFNLDYGIGRQWQIGLSIPYLIGEIGQAEGADIGDVSASIRYAPIRNPESFEAALYLVLSYPSGMHDREYLRDEEMGLFLKTWVTGDPNVDLMSGVGACWTAKNLAIEAWAEYVYTFEGEAEVDYGDLMTEVRDIDPGDGVNALLAGTYQVWEKLAVLVELSYISRTETELDGEGLDDEMMSFSLGPGISYHFGPEFDVFLKAHYTLDGINSSAGTPFTVGVRSRF